MVIFMLSMGTDNEFPEKSADEKQCPKYHHGKGDEKPWIFSNEVTIDSLRNINEFRNTQPYSG